MTENNSKMASTSNFIIKKVEKRTTLCLRCNHSFKFPSNLYTHLWNNKTDCNPESKISLEEAKNHANILSCYKCQFCELVIIDKELRHEHELVCPNKNIIDTLKVNDVDPIISYLFASDDDGNIISNVDKDSGYIDATMMCKTSGKDFWRYTELEETKEFIKELIHELNVAPLLANSAETRSHITHSEQSIIIQKSYILNPKVNHTYIHELLAIQLARWCNPKYAVKISKLICNYNKGLLTTQDSKKANKDIQDINNGIKKINIISSKNYIEKHTPQFYFRKLITRPSEVELYDSYGERVIDDEYTIFKGGSQGDHTGRQGKHICQLKGSILIDSIECFDYNNLEEYIKDIAREMNILCSIENNENKNLNGTEYFIFKTQEEYNNLIDKAYKRSEKLNEDIKNKLMCDNNLELLKEKTKQMELETRNKEIDLELKKLEMKEKEYIIIQEKEKILTKKIELNEKEIQLSMLKDVRNKNDKIRYYGVTQTKSWDKETTIYMARINHNGKQIYLGAYDTPEKASYACNCKRIFLNYEINKNSNIDYSKIYIFDNDKNRLVLRK